MTDIRERLHQQLISYLDNVSQELVDLLASYTQDSNLRVIMLMGSGASGDLLTYSDLDIVFLWGQSFSYPAYELVYINEQLISLTSSTYQEWQEKFSRLEEAIFARKAMLNSVLIYEIEKGLYNDMRIKAEQIDVDRFETERSLLINHMTIGFVEELHKVFNGVVENNEHLIHYGLMGLQLGIWKVLTQYFRLYFDSENDVGPLILEDLVNHKEEDMVDLWYSMWSINASVPMVERGKAAVKFYMSMVNLIDEELTPKSREFLKITRQLAERVTSSL